MKTMPHWGHFPSLKLKSIPVKGALWRQEAEHTPLLGLRSCGPWYSPGLWPAPTSPLNLLAVTLGPDLGCADLERQREAAPAQTSYLMLRTPKQGAELNQTVNLKEGRTTWSPTPTVTLTCARKYSQALGATMMLNWRLTARKTRSKWGQGLQNQTPSRNNWLLCAAWRRKAKGNQTETKDVMEKSKQTVARACPGHSTGSSWFLELATSMFCEISLKKIYTYIYIYNMYITMYIIYKIRCYKFSTPRNITLEVTSPSNWEKDCCLPETFHEKDYRGKRDTLPSTTLSYWAFTICQARFEFSVSY